MLTDPQAEWENSLNAAMVMFQRTNNVQKTTAENSGKELLRFLNSLFQIGENEGQERNATVMETMSFRIYKRKNFNYHITFHLGFT